MKQEIGRASIGGVSVPIVRDTDHDRFEIRIGGQTAILTYHLKQHTLSLIHTEVPPSQRRKGSGRLSFVRPWISPAASGGP